MLHFRLEVSFFWLTINVFCENQETFEQACRIADDDRVGSVLETTIGDLNVLKFSLPRPETQGTRLDSGRHGASFTNLLARLSDRIIRRGSCRGIGIDLYSLASRSTQAII